MKKIQKKVMPINRRDWLGYMQHLEDGGVPRRLRLKKEFELLIKSWRESPGLWSPREFATFLIGVAEKTITGQRAPVHPTFEMEELAVRTNGLDLLADKIGGL